ncbi:Rap guanine nucleotide exchange factor-like 1 [Trebouxia sp. C0010 RCD-2024]
MSAEDNEAYGLTTGMLDTLPEFSPQDDRSSSPSPGSSPGSASEQSAAFNTAKVGRLSRRATFAPTVIESFDDNTMQPVLFRLPSDPQQSAQQPSVAKQSGVAKQSSVTTQVSMAKQSSFPKQSSLRIQPSIASQASSVSQTSTTRVYSTDQSRPVPLSSGKSIETGRIPAKRSSSTLQSRKSLQSMKTAKVDDLLHDYKFAVERKAKPAEAQAGQHALELDAAMKRLTLEWIAEKSKPGDAFLTAAGKGSQKREKPDLQPSSLLPAVPVLQPDAPPAPAAPEKYESIVVPSDRQALRKVTAKPTSMRQDSELTPILRVLQKVEFTAALETAVLRQLARFVMYESYPAADHIVVKQGDPGALFYIILSGCVAIKVASKDSEKTVRTLDAGQAFGELALLKTDGRRAASVVTAMASEFLTIDGQQYQQLLGQLQREELRAKVDVLRRAPMFRGWSATQLNNVAGLVQLQRLPYNTVVVEQGTEADCTFFIKSGEVRVVRRMEADTPFWAALRKDPYLGPKYAPASTKHRSYEEAPFEKVPVSRTTPSAPASSLLPTCKAAADTTSNTLFNARPEEVWLEIMTYGQYESFGESAALQEGVRGASIITNMYTELLVLTKHDLVQNISTAAKEALEEVVKKRTPDHDLMRSAQQRLRWDKYKHDLVQGILWGRNRQDRLIDYTTDVKKFNGSSTWR